MCLEVKPHTRSNRTAREEQSQVKQIRVLIADSYALIRTGVSALLTNMPEVQSVIEAGDGVEALRLIEQHQPDLALLDLTMPKPNGLELAARIRKEFPAVRVIILSFDANSEYARQALSAGAAGFLLKNTTRAEFETAVYTVAGGKTHISPSVSSHLVEYRSSKGRRNLLEGLTPRQRETLQLIAENQSTKEIALRLNISVKTVEAHRARLMARLDIHSVAGLVRYAIKKGLIQLED
jgi:DNA-binding NarL/FixJ family response regulator